MALANYTDLLAEVASYLARDDLTARVPDFVLLAEAKFNRELRCIQMEKRSTALVNILSTEPQYISLPSDFQSMRSLRLNEEPGKPRLEYMNNTEADEYTKSVWAQTGKPQFFTVFGSELQLMRTPDAAYALEMKYRAYIPALVTNSTNWLMTLAPDAYLYGALLEAAPYMKEDQRLQTWGAGLASTIDGLNRLSMDQTYGSGPLVMRVSTVTP
jgi:hypothetical protein